MVILDIIKDISPLKQWDGYIYNDKNIDSIDMQVTRPYKRVEQVTASKTFGNIKQR